MKITLIIGLPGSGKTYLAYTICDVVIDDITSLAQLPADVDEFVITDVNFCDASMINRAENILYRWHADVEIERIYFENDSTKARKNVEYRNDGRKVEGTIRRFERIYNPPATVLPIWQHDE